MCVARADSRETPGYNGFPIEMTAVRVESMNEPDIHARLSQISTRWSDLREAHARSSPSAMAARGSLVEEYVGAVYRYLLASVRDADVAEDLAHEFIVRFLRGDFGKARPERGRFRDYVKAAVVNLLYDHYRRKRDDPGPLPSSFAQQVTIRPGGDDGQEDFSQFWRTEVLERTWEALNQDSGNYYEVLRIKADHPDAQAPEIAARLAGKRGREVSPATVRKTLQRARAKFADLLIDEVAKSLETPDAQSLEAELKELDLLRFCTAALARRGQT